MFRALPVLTVVFALAPFAPAEEEFAPRQAPLPVAAPEGAIVLFDGMETNRFLSMAGEAEVDWPIEDGALVSARGDRRSNHLVSSVHFRDAEIHVEFMLPEKGSGNSGIYIHGNYELQIFNSHGKENPDQGDMGAVYGFAPPLVNAARPPGEWQVYDIRYRGPRRNAEGEIVEEGVITAWLNGQKVQENMKVGEPRSKYHPFRYGTTPYLEAIWKKQLRTSVGPLFLQDHDSPVRFRNVWIRPLDEHAQEYEPVSKVERPNLLLIVADDLCWRDFGFVGNADVKTPHLNALAAEGMTLRGMFSPATTCSPARHALYTGLYCIRAGAYPNHTRAYDGTRSIFTHLKEHGYRVALQGKQHVGPPATFPFEHLKNPDDIAPTKEFVERDTSQPWMLAFASNDPHSPWTRGPQDFYDPAKLTVPPYLHDNATTRRMLAAYYAEITKLDEQVGELMRLLDEAGQAENTLVLFVSEQGSSFPYGGKWLMYDNGIRVTAVARWPGKIAAGSKSEALMQYVDVAPTFLAAAGIDPAEIDTGCPDAEGERGFDGRSFLEVLRGESNQLRDYVFAQHTTVGIIGYKDPYPMRAVRDERYKLIRNLAPQNTYSIRGIHEVEPLKSWQEEVRNDPQLAARIEWLFHRPAEELYDLESDSHETKNLADDAAYDEIKTRLGRELDAWMTQQGDRGMETELNARSRQGSGERKAPAPKAKRKKKQASGEASTG